MKTAKSISIPFVPVDDLIDSEVAPAIKNFIGKLRSAAEEDERLTKHRDESDPAAAGEMFDKTYALAVAGDPAAERRIFDMGSRESLVQRQQQIWDIREKARCNNAFKNIDLFNAASEAAIPAVKRALETAQAQHRNILIVIGEAEADSKTIAQNVGWRLHALDGLGENCRGYEGARSVLEAARFTQIVMGAA